MKNKINWGILSTAKIALTQIIPAMQQSDIISIAAIASRNLEKATKVAQELNIPRAYGSYEELLDDEGIDAVYIPVPNNLHVEYTIKALKAGKHVLCEKPVGMNAAEAQLLADTAKEYPHLKVMEAFMYRFHPQWLKAKEIIADGLLGEVKNIQAFFSYYNADANNIRNKPETGGGGLMDIGCYCISFPRFITGLEPKRVIGLADTDPVMNTDRITSGLLDFGSGVSASFTCSTQLEPFQRLNVFGTKGRLEIEIPVNAPGDKQTFLYLQNNREIEKIAVEPANQYKLQGEAFSNSIFDGASVPTPLTDAINNMKVIDAILESAKSNNWISLV
jgi:predicted dehydrogenase